MEFFVTFDDFAAAMAFDENEKAQFDQLLNHVFFGLHADNLIEVRFQYGNKEGMTKIFSSAPDGGIVCAPSALGAELFLSAFGLADQHLDHVFSDMFPQFPEGIPHGFGGALATKA